MEDYVTDINSELYSSDIDDLNFEPEIVKSDDDATSKEYFGY